MRFTATSVRHVSGGGEQSEFRPCMTCTETIPERYLPSESFGLNIFGCNFIRMLLLNFKNCIRRILLHFTWFVLHQLMQF